MRLYGANGLAARALGWTLTRVVEVVVLTPIAVWDAWQQSQEDDHYVPCSHHDMPPTSSQRRPNDEG